MIEIEEVYDALEASIKLQSHYAKLLNAYDGGERLTFRDAKEWIDRLRRLAENDKKSAHS